MDRGEQAGYPGQEGMEGGKLLTNVHDYMILLCITFCVQAVQLFRISCETWNFQAVIQYIQY